MANGWIKMEKKLRTDPRLLVVAEALAAQLALVPAGSNGRNVTRNDARYGAVTWAVTLVVGAMCTLWMMADDHVRDGDVLFLTVDQIDQFLGIPGFAKLLPQDWLEVVDSKSVKLPNYHGHNTFASAGAMTNAERQAKYRDKMRQQREGNGATQGKRTVTSNEMHNVTGNVTTNTDKTSLSKIPPLPPARGGRRYRNPERAMKAESLQAFRAVTSAIKQFQDRPTPNDGKTWMDLDATLEPQQAWAVRQTPGGHVNLAKHEAEFRDAYEKLLMTEQPTLTAGGD